VGYQDLPEDMQVLIADLCGRVDDPDNGGVTFAVFALDISAFPVVDVEDDPRDTQYLVDYLDVPMDCFPPVLVLGEYWLDGRHRVAAARAQGIEAIDAIDVTSLVDDVHLQRLEGWSLGRLSRTPAGECAGADRQVPEDHAAGGAVVGDEAADDHGPDPTVAYRPRWPRPSRGQDQDGGDISL
jgi:hypothetical protein